MKHVNARVLMAVAAVTMTASCGGSQLLPAAPSSNVSPTTLRITVDGLADATAIVNSSTVSLESTPANAAARYTLDFGDGESADAPAATHVYRTPGTFTAAVTTTDASGHRTTSSSTVTVQPLQLVLQQTPSPAVEDDRRRFEFTSQDGTTLRGIYSDQYSNGLTFEARLDAARHVTIVVDGRAPSSFGATVPTRFGARNGQPWLLTVTWYDRHGPGAIQNSQTLQFAEVP